MDEQFGISMVPYRSAGFKEIRMARLFCLCLCCEYHRGFDYNDTCSGDPNHCDGHLEPVPPRFVQLSPRVYHREGEPIYAMTPPFPSPVTFIGLSRSIYCSSYIICFLIAVWNEIVSFKYSCCSVVECR